MCDPKGMRTTLELDDDVLTPARKLAQERGLTLGQVVSELARKSLAAAGSPKIRNGVPLFTPKPGKKRPDLAIVNALRDEA